MVYRGSSVRLAKFTIHTYGLAVAVLVFLLPASITVAQAQSQPSSEPDKVDAATVRSMLERITELEAKVKDLKAAKGVQGNSDNTVTKPVQAQDASSAARPESIVPDMTFLETRRALQ